MPTGMPKAGEKIQWTFSNAHDKFIWNCESLDLLNNCLRFENPIDAHVCTQESWMSSKNQN